MTQGLPHWDMEVVFPGLDSPEFEAACAEVDSLLARLESLFNTYGIATDGGGDIGVFDELMLAFNELNEKVRTVTAFIRSFTTTNSLDELASAQNSEMDKQLGRLRKLSKSFTAWLGRLNAEELFGRSQLAREHEFAVMKAEIGAQHLMAASEESLASDMEITGMFAWTKLHGNVVSRLTASICLEEGKQDLPMSVVRTLASSPKREVREAAFRAELEAWKSVEVPLSAALNSVKGETLSLGERRGWKDPLDETLFNCNMDRATLDAMMEAARESFPDFRRYLSAKARCLGIEKLAFFDLFAPVGESADEWDYDRAKSFVIEQFTAYSEKLGSFAERAFRENWIDVPPRAGKSDGAFCMGLRKDESRILLNYEPSFGAVSTLAHELGHGYHNLCLNGRTAVQRTLPMTLAETASIFCETIIRQAVLRDGAPSDQFVVLEASLQGSCQVVVDISSRFLFERAVFRGRRKRELSSREMCEHMLDAQQATYGDGLDQEQLHPYMWAAKSHYYGRSFYNFPYMFGLLFGLGLYSVYEKEPNTFHGRYDDLLSSTGMADAATLGRRFGIDITQVEFWRGSLDQIRADICRFEALCPTPV
ncbi:MAG: M3 family oligoendopeptidase [Fimbriimonas sp.]|nr:M3 family oligoendopeptidase [Fimbriimonas sp.]